MNEIGFVSIALVVALFLFSVYLLMLPRGKPMWGFNKRWIGFGVFGLLILFAVLFYVAGFSSNNVMTTYTINGTQIPLLENTTDLPNPIYFQLVNYLTFIGCMFSLIAIVRETSIMGIQRENKRRTFRD